MVNENRFDKKNVLNQRDVENLKKCYNNVVAIFSTVMLDSIS